MIRWKMINEYGGIKTNLLLGNRKDALGLDAGYLAVAAHFQRDYRGGMFTVFRDATA